ncbi:restriction endonuclease subunit S [Escherichia coli]|uniref:restriction endonuclease subunit S n=1 Tax=Escherichia coli TaxID=562 RepID=UPI001C5E93A7|nr:restriction endonuclease subunit S [Escherichia coli]EFN5065481.1 restriction endonuclease subunit S [Escherichia coli]EHI1088006.1 restriction endonuclease subunit S [Escherichia coli]EKQ3325578.1 restriction endonuclease subunit S [Escherichia coli]EKR4929772.1 restriction endonuclease subunit S [Escherichia coli]EKR5644907.1 restriction endonuclease subunit S [Escherichia coli]
MVPKGWITKALELTGVKVIDGDRGKEYPKASDFSGDGYCLFLSAKNVTKYGFQFNELQFIDAEKDKKLRKGRVKRSNIVLTTRGSVGHFAYYDASVPYDVMRINSGMVILDADESDLEPNFLYALCRSFIVQKQIEAASFGSAQPQLTVGIVKGLKLPIPTLVEQKKIAQILSTWDKAISVTEKLLTNSQQQKKALMQQLLTGKKRLGLPAGSYEFKITRYGSIPKDWDYPAIKEICTQVSEKNSAAVDHPVLSCSKYDGFVDSLKYFNKKVYSDDLSGYRLIHRGCFGFPSNHIEEGSIGLQNLYDTGIVSPIYVVFRASPTKVDNSYLYAVLKTDHYKQIFGAATNASVDRRGSLRWKEFNQIHVPLPPLKEQQKISAVLSAADAEITTLEKKLACLKDEKKALMQQLLTGKRRVKVDEAVAE